MPHAPATGNGCPEAARDVDVVDVRSGIGTGTSPAGSVEAGCEHLDRYRTSAWLGGTLGRAFLPVKHRLWHCAGQAER